MSVSPNALALLDSIETREMRSLEWGFTDGSLSREKTCTEGDGICAGTSGMTGQDLVRELIDARLLHDVTGEGGETRLRSRFAEMMRLLAANRQLSFGQPWQGAPPLVSEFRVDRRPRRFPRRHLSPDDVLPDILAVTLADVLAGHPSTRNRLREELRQALTAQDDRRPAAVLADILSRYPSPRNSPRLYEELCAALLERDGTRPGDILAETLPARNGPALSDDTSAHFTLRAGLWKALTAAHGDMRLADFQERAIHRLLKPGTGTIVTAGTGSGKTMAFFLPAMLRIAEEIDHHRWVKAVALYPRTELLKDQFAEAFRMARSIDATLQDRPVAIGALFSETPTEANARDVGRKWDRHGSDYVCPWMRCPHCRAALVWRADDIAQERERLTCVQARHNGCSPIGGDQVVLTRRSLQRNPPDILFTTTETLNQRLSDQWTRHLFGVGPDTRRPLFAFLDEVHTYEGTGGAQAALTLRRWRHLLCGWRHRLRRPVTWVGLSATLDDAARFFSDLTGVTIGNVAEIAPGPDEFEEHGAEYQILLRGDPASRTTLLATTIQTSILLPRLLDPPGKMVSGGVFGQRAFLFTEDLDVTNRIYDNLRDVEGERHGRMPLADLRADGPDAAERDLAGQRWEICEEIGHPLNRGLRIGRTTAQDRGVDQDASIIVATAALEVGFNDLTVGAVIQHKAPRSMASFLQRKGRAGRSRTMRPVTLTVLSDYGRDRAFYQAFEHLFDPSLEPQYLPVHNSHVMKIQAVYALFDWLADRTAGYEKASMWKILSGPFPKLTEAERVVLAATMDLLDGLVAGRKDTIDSLTAFLQGALGIDHDTVRALLWEAPRPLLPEAVPTLHRRLSRNWQPAFPTADVIPDVQVPYHPLPDFVPRSLFSDISLPEVQIIIPPAPGADRDRREAMPVLQALNQFAPGRVTRRFVHGRNAPSHWIALDPEQPDQRISISDYAPGHEFVGCFSGSLNDDAGGPELPVFRPWKMCPEPVPRGVMPAGDARLAWRSDIVANDNPTTVAIPRRSKWRNYVQALDFHLHRDGSGISVRRFAATARASLRQSQAVLPVAVSFTVDGASRPAAVGFELDVDGLRLDLTLPDAETLACADLPADILADARLAYIRDRIRTDPELPDDLNPFQRDWLLQFLLSALFADAATHDRPLAGSVSDLLGDDARMHDTFRRVMDDVFGAMPCMPPDTDETPDADAPDDADQASDGEKHPADGQLRQALQDHLDRPVVRARLRALAAQLVEIDTAAFGAWLRRLVVETLAEATLQACIAAVPRQASMDTLLVDIRDDAASGTTHVWVSETTPGSAGILDACAERFVREPHRFVSALDMALMPESPELVDGSLRTILALIAGDDGIRKRIAGLRGTDSHSERAKQWRELSRELRRHDGIVLSRAFSVSLNNRLLGPGSGPELDRLLHGLQAHWDTMQARFGIAIGLREYAYVASRDAALSRAVRDFLATALPDAAPTSAAVLSTITGMLWPRASEVRQHVLQSYNPFRQTRATDAAIVRQLLLAPLTVTIEFGDPDWQARLAAAFETCESVRIAAPGGSSECFRTALVRLLATPVDLDAMRFFPAIDRVERTDGRIVATLILRELT